MHQRHPYQHQYHRQQQPSDIHLITQHLDSVNMSKVQWPQHHQIRICEKVSIAMHTTIILNNHLVHQSRKMHMNAFKYIIQTIVENGREGKQLEKSILMKELCDVCSPFSFKFEDKSKIEYPLGMSQITKILLKFGT